MKSFFIFAVCECIRASSQRRNKQRQCIKIFGIQVLVVQRPFGYSIEKVSFNVFDIEGIKILRHTKTTQT